LVGVNLTKPLLANQVVEMKRGILAGCKLKMDDGGNILVKR
jgi:hypothetical protein